MKISIVDIISQEKRRSMRRRRYCSTLSDGGLPDPLAALDKTLVGRGEEGTAFNSLRNNFF